MMRLTILVLSLSAGLTAADYRDIHKTVTLDPTGAVRVDTHKGSIHVSTWDRSEVEIQARITAEASFFMNRRLFELTEVLIDSTADSVRIRTKYPDIGCCSFLGGNNPEVRYTIHMPRTARLTIRDHRSETSISGLQGALDFQTHRGEAKVVRLAGPLRLETHRGDVSVQFSSFTGNSSITTHRGKISLALPRAAGFQLEADLSRHAKLDSSFTVITQSSRRRGEKLRGAVNGGGPVLRLESHRGDIRVSSSSM